MTKPKSKPAGKVLLKDILIPAGTVFPRAGWTTRNIAGDDHFEYTLGLTKDTSGSLTYCVDESDPKIAEWFGDTP